MRFGKRQRRLFSRWLCFVMSVFWVFGCNDSVGRGGGSQSGSLVGNILNSINLGEELFQIYRANVANSTDNPAGKVAVLDARKAEFVDAVNAIVVPSSVQGIGPTLAAILTMVDDGTLPEIAEGVASALELLINDPNREVLQAILAVSESKTVVQNEDVIAFFGRTVNYPEFQDVLTSVAELIRNNDGVDDSGQPNGERDLVTELTQFLSDVLSEADFDQTGGGKTISDVIDELLIEAQISGNVTFGPPVWVVRVDENGNPKVAVDPATSTLVPPFIDLDGDLVADVGSDGRPIDATGAAIEIPAFGGTGTLDADRRPVTVGGLLYYDYFDAKKTLLSLFLQNTGSLLEHDFHSEAFELFQAALGQRNVYYDNGTADPADDYWGYSSDTPLHDLIWAAIELGRLEEIPLLLSALSAVIEQDPDRGQRLLVGVGVAIDKLKAVPPTPGASGNGTLLEDMIPILDDVFETPSAGGASTARTIFQVFHDAHTAARELPRELALMVKYREAVRETTPDNDTNLVDEAASIPVDWSMPSSYSQNGVLIDNRSDLHQLLDMLAHFSNCHFLGKSLAEWVLSIASDLTPQTVSGLIGIITTSFGSFLANLVCPGAGQDLAALDVLAQSGGLDGLLPLLKAFNDRGEMGVCMALLLAFQQNYETTIRPVEPRMVEVLESGAVEELLDLLAEANTVAVPNTNDNAADILADFMAQLIEDDYPVTTRTGGAVASRLHLLLDPADELATNLQGTQASVGGVVEALFAPILERAVDDNGTPSDPSDDFEVLQNQSFVPFVGRVLAIGSDAYPSDPAERDQMVADGQDALAKAIESRHFASMLEIGEVLQATGSPTLSAALVNLFTPQPQATDDVFGALIRLIAAGLQYQPDATAGETIAHFVGEILEPSRGLVVHLIRGLARFLAIDQGQTAIGLLQNSLNPAPGQAQSPVGLLVEVIQDVQAQGTGGGGLTLSTLEDGVQSTIDFIRDDQSGLERIFDFLRNRF